MSNNIWSDLEGAESHDCAKSLGRIANLYQLCCRRRSRERHETAAHAKKPRGSEDVLFNSSSNPQSCGREHEQRDKRSSTPSCDPYMPAKHTLASYQEHQSGPLLTFVRNMSESLAGVGAPAPPATIKELVSRSAFQHIPTPPGHFTCPLRHLFLKQPRPSSPKG